MSGIAVVTGASGGLGREVALRLARRGLTLALLGRASERQRETAQLVQQAGGLAALELATELAEPDSIERAAARVLAELGTPTVVIHNAGVVRRASIEETSLEAWNEQLDVNLRAPFLLTRSFMPSMRAARSGRFVFVGSISSTLGSPRAAAYAAAKWGVVGFMKSLAEELRDSGLVSCAVLPGSIDTEMLKGSGFAPRMSAEEVARSIEFLALDAPAAHNGAVLEMFGV